MYFKKLNWLPSYPSAYQEMLTVFKTHNIDWPTKNLGPNKCQQICISHIEVNSDDLFLGAGSDQMHLKSRELYEDINFKHICKQFKGSVFEEIKERLDKHFIIGRMRLIKINPHICLGWHKDLQNRIHYPLKTKKGAFMVIENEVMHLEQDTWYLAKTVNNHTALNASDEERIHLLITVWDRK